MRQTQTIRDRRCVDRASAEPREDFACGLRLIALHVSDQIQNFGLVAGNQITFFEGELIVERQRHGPRCQYGTQELLRTLGDDKASGRAPRRLGQRVGKTQAEGSVSVRAAWR